jgi:diacylglycerol O-acyltransferase
MKGMVERLDVHMRASDAFSWYMERDPLLRSTVVVVLFFDRCPDPELLRDRAERASRIVPGLRHRIVEAPLRLAPARWTAIPTSIFRGTYAPSRCHPRRR